MSAVTITQMADRVSTLVEQRLGVRGRSLADKLKRAGRRLPKAVREAATYLADAAEMAQNPKLLARLDEAEVARAYDICLRHLNRLNRGERQKTALLRAAASVAFALLVVVTMVVVMIYWRGLV